MTNCIVCNNKINIGYLCSSCKNNPFNVETLRDYLSKRKNYSFLKKTYNSGYKEIKNCNSRQFWDSKFLIEDSSKKSKNNCDCMTKEKIKDIKKFLEKRYERLLDIGIGLGYLEKELVKINKKISLFGIDTSSFAIKKNRCDLRGTFILASVYKIPFVKNFFNIVVCLEVLEHLSPSKILIALKEIYRVLERGGSFIVSVPLNEGLEDMLKRKHNPNCHVRNYTKSIIEAELETSGFKMIKYKYYYAFEKHYLIKNFLVRTFFRNYRKPNNLLIFTIRV